MKFFKFFFLFILFAAIVIGSLFVYYKRQLSYKPDWYNKSDESPVSTTVPPAIPIKPEKSPNARPSTEPDRRPAGLSGRRNELTENRREPVSQPASQMERDLAVDGIAEIHEDELMPLLLGSMAGEDGENLAAAVKAAKTTIHPGSMTVEMIIDVNKIPPEELQNMDEKTALWLKEMMQKTGLQELYIKADLHPLVHGNQMVLLPASSLSIGKVTFSLDDLQKKLALPTHIDMDRFVFTGMQLLEDKIVIIK